MARVAINTGATANDGSGDTLRAAGGIINDNFLEIYTHLGAGSTTTLSAPVWNTTSAGINTLRNVGIGTTNPRFALEVGAVGSSGTSLHVNGNARITGILTVGTSSITLDGVSDKITVGSGVTIDGTTGIISATSIVLNGSAVTGAGVTSITAGSGISINQSTGNVTITATGGGGGGTSYWEQTAAGINTSSNVGIGTTNPTSALTVKGNTSLETLSVSGVSTFSGSNTYFDGSIICSTYAGTSRIILTGGTGGNTNFYNGGTSYSDFIFTAFQGGASIELARINKNGVLSLPYAGGGLNVVGVSTFSDTVYVGSDFTISRGASTTTLNSSTAAGTLRLANNTFGGKLELRGGTVSLETSNGGDKILVGQSGAGVTAYHNGYKKFETIGAGVTVTGTTFTEQLSVSGVTTTNGLIVPNIADFNGVDALLYHTGNQKFATVSDGISVSGVNRIVTGSFGFGDADDGGIKITTNSTDQADIYHASAGILNIDNYRATGGSIAFRATDGSGNTTEQARITSSGVGIGTTNPTEKLTVAGIVSATSFYGSNTLKSRTVVSATTGSVGAGNTENLSITGYKSYSLLKVGISSAAWVVLYTDADSRTSDVSRSYLTDPTPGSGVIAEVRTTTAGISTFIMSPGIIGWNNDVSVGSTIYAKVTNNESSNAAITVDLTVVKLED